MENHWGLAFIFCVLCSCEPIEERILGTYRLDTDRGCSNCEATGPEIMRFEDVDVFDEILGQYSFSFNSGEEHSGTYGFFQVDSAVVVMLYPDSASNLYGPLIGQSIRTDYKVSGNRVKERCNGAFRNCSWFRTD
jgi:hypothetical protein